MRRQKRQVLHPADRIAVVNRLSGELMGYVVDLSPLGFRMLSDFPVAPGSCFEMRLEVQIDENSHMPVDVAMLCRWSRRHDSTGGFQAGFFLDRQAEEFGHMTKKLLAQQKYRWRL